MKKTLIFLVVCAAVGGGVFLYMTRPVSAPSVQTNPDSAPSIKMVTTPGTELFAINPAKSEAKFEINEVLAGEPFRVVGTTSVVEGYVMIDPANPAVSSVGTIQINARTIKTDSTRRDGAIGRAILKSETNEFITFTPRSFVGLPSTVQIGQEYSLQTTGALVVAGVSQDITFDIKAKMVSETEVSGVATTSFDYKDFDITIPKVPMVASVEDQVDLTFTFVAERK